MVIQVVLGYVVGVLAALATLHPRRWGMVGAVAVLAYAVWVLAGQPGSREGLVGAHLEDTVNKGRERPKESAGPGLEEERNEVEAIATEKVEAMMKEDEDEAKVTEAQAKVMGAEAQAKVEREETVEKQAKGGETRLKRKEWAEESAKLGLDQTKAKELLHWNDKPESEPKVEAFTPSSLFSPRSHDVAASFNGCRVYRESILRPKESLLGF